MKTEEKDTGNATEGRIGLWAVVAIGVGGMVGGHVLLSLIVITITGLNLLSAESIGRAEDWIVGLKVTILLLFIAVGLAGVKTSQIAPDSWSPPLQLAAGGMIMEMERMTPQWHSA